MDSVTCIPPDNSVALGLDNLLNLVANLAVGHARLADGDGLLGRLSGRVDEVHRLLVDLANRVRLVQICVHATPD